MDIKDEIHKNFKDDKLFNYLINQGFTEKQLYSELLDYINTEKIYSTIQVAEMLNVSDNDLRYYMKIMRAIGYIKSFKAGRNYRFNYLQVYQMYLVVSILNLPHHTTSDIKRLYEHKKSELFNPKEENQISSSLVKETKASIVPLNTFNSVSDEGQILMKQYEIAVIEQKLNAHWRIFLQLDSKFNLALMENKYAAELKDALKHSKTGWFTRNTNDLEALATSETRIGLMDMKEKLTTMQTNISDYEKELTLKTHELKQLIDEKLKLLKK